MQSLYLFLESIEVATGRRSTTSPSHTTSRHDELFRPLSYKQGSSAGSRWSIALSHKWWIDYCHKGLWKQSLSHVGINFRKGWSQPLFLSPTQCFPIRLLATTASHWKTEILPIALWISGSDCNWGGSHHYSELHLKFTWGDTDSSVNHWSKLKPGLPS